jgi:hypothetical protein
MDLETGLPEDSELARRRMIEDADDRRLRDLRRQNYEASGDDELDALIDQIQRKEDERVEKREKALQKEAEKAAKRTQEENSVS